MRVPGRCVSPARYPQCDLQQNPFNPPYVLLLFVFWHRIGSPLKSSISKSWGPLWGSDLVIDDSPLNNLVMGDGSRSGPSPC